MTCGITVGSASPPTTSDTTRRGRRNRSGGPDVLRCLRSQRQDVGGLRALGALGHLEADVLSLFQFAVALGGDRGVVGEHVGAAPVLLDEPEALLRVEPLHSAGCHTSELSFMERTPRT